MLGISPTAGDGGGDDNAETTALIPGGFRTRIQSAGDGFDYPYGVWVAYSHTNFEEDFAATAFDGDTDAVFVGADFSPWDNYYFGVALGYDKTDIDTTFNGGQQDLSALSVVPYLSIALSDALDTDLDFSMDMAVGYSSVDIDQFRLAGATRITSSTSADRFFWSSNVNVGQTFGDFYINGRAGVLYAVDDTSGFTDSGGTVVGDFRSELGRISAGAGISYLWNDNFEPYVNASLRHDYEFTRSGAAGHPNDPTDVRMGIGVRYYGDQWSGSVQYGRTLGRENFDSDTIGISIRGDF